VRTRCTRDGEPEYRIYLLKLFEDKGEGRRKGERNYGWTNKMDWKVILEKGY
jgi:hypothetical protein